MAVNEIGKIITHKTPTILYENISLSHRNDNKYNLIILPFPKNSKMTNSPIFSACSFWSMFIKKIGIPNPFCIVLNVLKRRLKTFY